MAPENPSIMYQPPSSLIHGRFGPIFDEAYLGKLDPTVIREITLISARAELTAAQAHVHALESAIKVIESAKIDVHRG